MRTTRLHRMLTAATIAALVVACGGTGDEADAPADGDEGSPATADEEGDDAAGDDAAEAPGGTIQVAYLETGSSTAMFLTAEKYAAEVGIDLEMNRVSSGQESLTGVATGQFDVGFAGIGSGAYNAYEEGLPVSFVAPMHAGYLEDYFILSSTVAADADEAASLAEDLSELAGETFAVNAPGVVTEALLGQALERGGLSYDEVNVEFIPFPDQVPALANGGIVGGILSEPFPTIAEQNDSGYRPWETPDTDPATFTGILYNDDWAASNPELAEAYMQAFAMAAADLAENGWDSDDALDALSQYTDADPEVLRQTRQHHIPADLTVDFDELVNYQQFYLDQGSLNYSELIPEEELWDFQWRDAVLSDGGS